ncbi:MAG: DNA internalization-related competence protein ComEC/Rec2 [Candidatus Nanopelagicales bacterium]
MVATAVAAWIGAGTGVLVAATGAVSAVAVGCAVIGALAGFVAAVFAPTRATVVPVLLVGVCATAVGALRVAPLVTGEVPAAATDGAYVTATVTLIGDPTSRSGRVHGSARGQDKVVAGAVLDSWRRGGHTRSSALPIRLSWSSVRSDLPPGTVLHVSGRLMPGDAPNRSAAFLVADEVSVVETAPPIQQAALSVRMSMRHSASATSGDGGALLPGLVLGDTAGVSDELAQAMRDAGLSHLTAVSGGNVAITLAMFWWVARRCGLRRRGLLVVGAIVLPAYVVLVRPDPSVVRAAVMAGIGLVALVGGFRSRGLPTLALAVTALLLVDPFLCLSLGFALSVVATAGLVTLGRRWTRPARVRLLRTVLAAWAAAAAASLATAPLVAGIGGGVPLLSIPANLLAAPAVAPAGVIGLVAALVGLVAPLPAQWLAALAALPAAWIAGIARHVQDVPGSVAPWPQGLSGALLLALVLALAGAAWWLGRRTRRRRPVAVALGAVGLVVFAPIAGLPLPAAAWPPPGWIAVACDVGQGDGIVLNAGGGAAVVVDAGPDPRLMDRCLARLGIRSVPVVVLSHDHADHVEGLPGVLRGRRVGQIIESPLAEPQDQAERVRRWTTGAGVATAVATAGEQWVVGSVTWQVLWPDRILHGTDSDPNNASLVLLVRAGGLTFLLGGDVEPEAQELLLRNASPGHVDVVKVPHHGSRKQDPSYAGITRPAIALVSVGVDNDYGHPNSATLQQYAAAGATIGRTDTSGDLAVVRDDRGRPVLLARGKD